VVAHTDGDVVERDFRIRSFYVSRELRNKRIGRGLLVRLEELAALMQCSRLVASSESPCARFFERAGFFVQADGILARELEHFSAKPYETIIRPAPQR
jgi:GNAT superfamily N-acetyltransferase